MRETEAWKDCRLKCSSDELADLLYEMLAYHFEEGWEGIIREIPANSVKSKDDIDDILYENR